MNDRFGIDEQSRVQVGEPRLLIEAKSPPAAFRSRRGPLGAYHWALLVVLGLCAITVSDFFATFLLLVSTLAVTLVAFVVLVQVPVRFLANRLRERRLGRGRDGSTCRNASSQGS